MRFISSFCNWKRLRKIKVSKPMVLIIVVIIFLLSTSGMLASHLFYPESLSLDYFPKNRTLEQIAQTIILQCASTSYKAGCYEKMVPLTMKTISMEDAFKVTKIIQQNDTSYAYCHVLGHKLSANEVDKDPNNWRQVIARCPSGICSNGCIHGAMQEKFRSESLTDKEIQKYMGDLKLLCEVNKSWNPTGLEQASCYHALGHLTMYITNADLNKSISLCDELAIKNDGRDYSRLCYDGIFMQIFQPLEPEDFSLIKGKEVKKENALTFCNSFDTFQRASCLSESWPLFIDDILAPRGILSFCGKEIPSEVGRCYSSLFYVLTARSNFENKKIISYCNQLPDDVSKLCFASSATRYLESDYGNIANAVAICTTAENVTVRDNCFDEITSFSTYNFHPGSPEALQLCALLPSPWNGRCKTSNS